MREAVITRGTAWRGDRRTLAELVQQAYAPLLAALGVDRESALPVLEAALDLEQCFVAHRGATVVGIVGVVEGRARPLRLTFATLRAHQGILRSLGYSLLLSLRGSSRPAAGELVFEMLVVSPAARRQGVGTRLVERVEAYADQRGYTSVGLDVTDSNHAAIRLYCRLDYRVVRTRRFGVLTRPAGFTGSYHMRKPTPPGPPCATPR